MGQNVIRVAEVWLDDYKELVYKVQTICCGRGLSITLFTEKSIATNI